MLVPSLKFLYHAPFLLKPNKISCLSFLLATLPLHSPTFPFVLCCDLLRDALTVDQPLSPILCFHMNNKDEVGPAWEVMWHSWLLFFMILVFWSETNSAPKNQDVQRTKQQLHKQIIRFTLRAFQSGSSRTCLTCWVHVLCVFKYVYRTDLSQYIYWDCDFCFIPVQRLIRLCQTKPFRFLFRLLWLCARFFFFIILSAKKQKWPLSSSYVFLCVYFYSNLSILVYWGLQ